MGLMFVCEGEDCSKHIEQAAVERRNLNQFNNLFNYNNSIEHNNYNNQNGENNYSENIIFTYETAVARWYLRLQALLE